MNLAKGVTVTRLRAAKVDDGYNGVRLDWSHPDRLDIPGCAMAPRVEDERRQQGRQGVLEAWTAYLPYGSDVTFEDRLLTPHGTFEVEGAPNPWRNPYTGRQAGMTVYLQRVDG